MYNKNNNEKKQKGMVYCISNKSNKTHTELDKNRG